MNKNESRARWPETCTQEIILTKPNPSQVTKKKHLRWSSKLNININKHAGRSKRGASTKSIIIKRNNSYLSLGGKEERDFVQKPTHPLHCSRLRLLRHQFHYYLQHRRNRRLACIFRSHNLANAVHAPKSSHSRWRDAKRQFRDVYQLINWLFCLLTRVSHGLSITAYNTSRPPTSVAAMATSAQSGEHLLI